MGKSIVTETPVSVPQSLQDIDYALCVNCHPRFVTA